jgi:polysaccharide biosynthesis/export protein
MRFLYLLKALLGSLAGIMLTGNLVLGAAPEKETQGTPEAQTADVEGKKLTDHRLAPLEIIMVDVFGEKDLSREVRVQASGKISFPLLGDVDVAGKTTTEVEKILKEMLGKDYLVDPQVMVAVKDYRLRYVNMIGQVVKPGAIPLPGEEKWTILDAIGQAGGLTRVANQSRIEFSRQGQVQTFSLEQLKKTTDPTKKIILEPGDTISVRESAW